ncbi:hypothetical protein SAMN06269301_2166 [Geobacter sp. DSM 9736]|nr:hypothetical protein SAMN06269301_2166 [Geobacter sp. DSM 9736]
MPDRSPPPKGEKCPAGICTPEAGNGCPHCGGREEKVYWCDVCREFFETKRCPQCGLKLKRAG